MNIEFVEYDINLRQHVGCCFFFFLNLNNHIHTTSWICNKLEIHSLVWELAFEQKIGLDNRAQKTEQMTLKKDSVIKI